MTHTDEVSQKEEAGTASTASPASPDVSLLLIEPLTPEDYTENFAEGDLSECYRKTCCTNVSAFRGSWQLLLGGRSDSVEELLGALGIGVLKRKVMASYASVTDIQPITDCPMGGNDCPTLQLTTHLPLKNTKQGRFCFDGRCDEVQDSDTGHWETRCVWLNGRAIQKRWGPLGTMWDTRCVFLSDPCKDNTQEGPVMLFQWTFHPKDRAPIKCLRWLKKL